jgi:hypothetical protein
LVAAYAHVPEKQLKLNKKAMKCIFTSYGVGVKGYNLCIMWLKRFCIAGMLFSEKLTLLP